jgi:hypothetical protein
MNARCVICDKGPLDVAGLFRVNPDRRPPLWACEQHLAQTDAQVSPELRRVSEILRSAE